MQIQVSALALLLSCAGLFELTAACSDHACVSSGISSEVGLAAHNGFRQAMGFQTLELNTELSTSASKCAQYYCQNLDMYTSGMMEIGSCPFRDNNTGENNFLSYYSEEFQMPVKAPENLTLAASNSWEEEGRLSALYAISQPDALQYITRYSQMMWGPASQVGFGVCTCEKDYQIVIALYDQPQTILNQEIDNTNNCQQNYTEYTTEFPMTTGAVNGTGNFPDGENYVSFSVFQHANFFGINSTIWLPMNPVFDGCMNLGDDLKGEISSIDTNGQCVFAFDGADCSGDMIYFQPYPETPAEGDCDYHNFSSCPTSSIHPDSPFPDSWNDRIVSLRLCYAYPG